MPVTIHVGLAKKIGQPDFGSLGASCNVQFEASSGLLEDDLEAFHRQVRNAYVACRQAVQDELDREQQPDTTANGNGHSAANNGNGHNGNGHANGKPHSNGRKATASQIRALHAIASRQGFDLLDALRERFGFIRPEDLGIGQASDLIAELTGTPNGSRR